MSDMSPPASRHFRDDVLQADARGSLHHRWLLAHDYALLDPTQVSPDAWKDLPATALAPDQLRHRAELLPHLIDLTSLSADDQSIVLDRITFWQSRGITLFGALLGTPSPRTSVAAHLSRQLLQRRPDDRRRWMLRFHDADVFRHLVWQLRPAQLDQLLGPIHVWSWPDASGDWTRYWRQSPETRPAALVIDAKQWPVLDRIEELNGLIAVLDAEAPDLTQDVRLWSRANDLLVRAQEREFIFDTRSRQTYAIQALQHHPKLHDHAVLRERLQRARQEQVPYWSVCRDLDAQALGRLAADLPSSDTALA